MCIRDRDTAAEAECGTLPSQIGGKATTATNSNSSSSVLEKKNDVKIVKAYLVVTTTTVSYTHLDVSRKEANENVKI